MFKLINSVQNYDWGKKGQLSLVGKLYNLDNEINNDINYAELWVGTHSKGPSSIIVNNNTIPLKQYINEDLPYLFKVLSIDKPLSIQSHPDKLTAKKLHKLNPINYPDDNHKPEMMIALSKFELLCQFRPDKEIIENLLNIEELTLLINDMGLVYQFMQNPSKELLKKIFTLFINNDKCDITIIVDSLQERLSNMLNKSNTDKLVLDLIKKYDNDIGIFCPYFMNYIELSPNDSIFINTNEPHAYISGNCIECMACSDNVIRAGLTHKFIDKEVLCNTLSYNMEYPPITKGIIYDSYLTKYITPISEFNIEKICLDKNILYPLTIQNYHTVLIVISGQGFMLSENKHIRLTDGIIIYQIPNIQTKITCTNKYNPLIIYRVCQY